VGVSGHFQVEQSNMCLVGVSGHLHVEQSSMCLVGVSGQNSGFILIYFSSIVKEAMFCFRKSRSNPFLEPTSTNQ